MAVPAVKRGRHFVGYRPEDNPANYRVPQRRRSLTPAQRRALIQPAPKETRPQADQDGSGIVTRAYAAAQANTSQTRQTDDLDALQPIPIRQNAQTGQQSSHQTTPWQGLLLAGACIAVALYTIIFLIVLAWISITNTLHYGPIHTSYTIATMNGHAYTIITSNVSGTISVTIISQKDNSVKTYTGPTLNSDAWGNDVNSIVATAKVAKDQTITVSLIGNINYFHLFFVRPTMTFSLVPDKQSGYKVVQP